MYLKSFIIIILFLLCTFRYVKLTFRYLRSVNCLNDIKRNNKRNIIFVFGVFANLLEAALLMSLYMNEIGYGQSNSTDNTDISIRIENISENLSQASNELSIIQEELEARVAYIDDLKREAEIAENVISLSEDQVNAVQAKLNQQLEESNNKNFIQSFIPGTIFFILGTIFTPLINFFISKFRKKDSTDNNTSAIIDGYSNEEILIALKLLKTVNNVQNDDASKPLIQEK